MKRIYFLVFLMCLIFPRLFSQEQKQFPLIVSVSDNASLMPGNGYLGVFTTPVHPGISAGTFIMLKNWKRSGLLESFRVGGFYQKYSQLSIQLYSELIYQYRFGSFAIEPQVQAGYMMAFTDMQVFKYNGHEYVEKSFRGRSQFMAGAGLGLSYMICADREMPVKLTLAYLANLQMPFIKNYSPVLIVTSLQLGAVFFIPCKNK